MNYFKDLPRVTADPMTPPTQYLDTPCYTKYFPHAPLTWMHLKNWCLCRGTRYIWGRHRGWVMIKKTWLPHGLYWFPQKKFPNCLWRKIWSLSDSLHKETVTYGAKIPSKGPQKKTSSECLTKEKCQTMISGERGFTSHGYWEN